MQRQKPNYELKSKVLKTNLCAVEKAISYSKFQHIDNDFVYDAVVKWEMEYLTNPETAEMYCEAKKINQASYKRSNRLSHRIAKIIQKPSIFMTLTFTDDVLAKTSADTRRRYVSRFLNTFGVPYVANLDFGAKNGREHYHGVLQMETINPLEWKFGALNVKKIRSSEDNIALAKYVSKLTNHAVKETTKRQAIIYSRD